MPLLTLSVLFSIFSENAIQSFSLQIAVQCVVAPVLGIWNSRMHIAAPLRCSKRQYRPEHYYYARMIKEKLTEKQVVERWNRYSNEALNRDLTPEHANSEREAENLNEEEQIPSPTYNEVSDIIQKLRNNQVPGPDIIISELIKEG